MNLETYFAEKQGVGVLSTADAKGIVNSAIYARPHPEGTDTIKFIMRDKRTRANLLENVKANYLFLEHERGYKGIRMYLTKVAEEEDREAIQAMSRRPAIEKGGEEARFLVTFKFDKVIALVGDDEMELS